MGPPGFRNVSPEIKPETLKFMREQGEQILLDNQIVTKEQVKDPKFYAKGGVGYYAGLLFQTFYGNDICFKQFCSFNAFEIKQIGLKPYVELFKADSLGRGQSDAAGPSPVWYIFAIEEDHRPDSVKYFAKLVSKYGVTPIAELAKIGIRICEDGEYNGLLTLFDRFGTSSVLSIIGKQKGFYKGVVAYGLAKLSDGLRDEKELKEAAILLCKASDLFSGRGYYRIFPHLRNLKDLEELLILDKYFSVSEVQTIVRDSRLFAIAFDYGIEKFAKLVSKAVDVRDVLNLLSAIPSKEGTSQHKSYLALENFEQVFEKVNGYYYSALSERLQWQIVYKMEEMGVFKEPIDKAAVERWVEGFIAVADKDKSSKEVSAWKLSLEGVSPNVSDKLYRVLYDEYWYFRGPEESHRLSEDYSYTLRSFIEKYGLDDFLTIYFADGIGLFGQADTALLSKYGVKPFVELATRCGQGSTELFSYLLENPDKFTSYPGYFKFLLQVSEFAGENTVKVMKNLEYGVLIAYDKADSEPMLLDVARDISAILESRKFRGFADLPKDLFHSYRSKLVEVVRRSGAYPMAVLFNLEMLHRSYYSKTGRMLDEKQLVQYAESLREFFEKNRFPEKAILDISGSSYLERSSSSVDEQIRFYSFIFKAFELFLTGEYDFRAIAPAKSVLEYFEVLKGHPVGKASDKEIEEFFADFKMGRYLPLDYLQPTLQKIADLDMQGIGIYMAALKLVRALGSRYEEDLLKDLDLSVLEKEAAQSKENFVKAVAFINMFGFQQLTNRFLDHVKIKDEWLSVSFNEINESNINDIAYTLVLLGIVDRLLKGQTSFRAIRGRTANSAKISLVLAKVETVPLSIGRVTEVSQLEKVMTLRSALQESLGQEELAKKIEQRIMSKVDLLALARSASATGTFNAEDIERVRLQLNRINRVYGDELVLAIGVQFSKEPISRERFFFRIAETRKLFFSDPSGFDDVNKLYRMVGRFQANLLASYFINNQDKFTEGEQKKAISELDKMGVAVSITESSGSKLLRSLGQGQLGYVSGKGWDWFRSSDVLREEYTAEYAKEHDVTFILKKCGELRQGFACSEFYMGKEKIATVVFGDYNEGARVSYDANVGEGIEIKEQEAKYKGRQVARAVAAYTTGERKLADFAVLDGEIANYLVSDREGLVVIYPDGRLDIKSIPDLKRNDIKTPDFYMSAEPLDPFSKLEDFNILLRKMERVGASAFQGHLFVYNGKIRISENSSPVRDKRRCIAIMDDGRYALIDFEPHITIMEAAVLAGKMGVKHMVNLDTGMYDYSNYWDDSGKRHDLGTMDSERPTNLLTFFTSVSDVVPKKIK